VRSASSPLLIHAALDSAHESWNRLLDALPQSPRPFLESLEPAWWVLRAAVAWLLIAGDGLPVLRDRHEVASVCAAVFAVVASVQLGSRCLGHLGPSAARSAFLARLALVGLNAFAVVVTAGRLRVDAVDRIANSARVGLRHWP
jgi:hypothetical protein